MKKIIFLFALILIVTLSIFAQTDSTGSDPGNGSPFPLGETAKIIIGAILGIYELLARLIPTLKNYSILGYIIKLLQWVFPNRSASKESKLP